MYLYLEYEKLPLCSIVILDAKNGGKTISIGYKQISDKSIHVIKKSSSCFDLIFLTTKICTLIMELIFPFLTNATTISYMVRLIFTYPCHQYMFVKVWITVRQILKIL